MSRQFTVCKGGTSDTGFDVSLVVVSWHIIQSQTSLKFDVRWKDTKRYSFGALNTAQKHTGIHVMIPKLEFYIMASLQNTTNYRYNGNFIITTAQVVNAVK